MSHLPQEIYGHVAQFCLYSEIKALHLVCKVAYTGITRKHRIDSLCVFLVDRVERDRIDGAVLTAWDTLNENPGLETQTANKIISVIESRLLRGYIPYSAGQVWNSKARDQHWFLSRRSNLGDTLAQQFNKDFLDMLMKTTPNVQQIYKSVETTANHKFVHGTKRSYIVRCRDAKKYRDQGRRTHNSK